MYSDSMGCEYNVIIVSKHTQTSERINLMKLIYFIIGAVIGYAIMTQVPGIDSAIVYGVAFLFGLLPAAVI
jgi:hypothetical protein